MQLNNIVTLSENFIGTSENVLNGINLFLKSVKLKNANKDNFHLVHALVFSKQMTEQQVVEINVGLGDLYRSHGFYVLGGDTSSGQELSIFISTIAF